MNTILITGSGRGLGRALARRFAKAEHRVYALSRRPATYPSFQNIVPITADVRDEAAVGAALARVLEPIDVLINNAGIPGTALSIDDGVVEDLRPNFETHCLGAAVVCEAVVKRFGLEALSYVVNISSRLGSLSDNRNGVHAHLETSYAYRVAKAAQNMLTVCLHQELHPHGVRVFGLHPGALKTEAASADANTTSEKAADDIFEWLRNAAELAPGFVYQTNGQTIAW